jgi:uncharacterized DUF497 family protein
MHAGSFGPFDWDEDKNRINLEKHGISFEDAKAAFTDSDRITAHDLVHSTEHENRLYCIGKVEGGVITVRFTVRNGKIRILGAGFWRKGRKLYEERNR